MKKRFVALRERQAAAIVEAAGGQFDRRSWRAAFRYDIDGMYGFAAWAKLVPSGKNIVEIQLGFAPEGIYIAGDDEAACQGRPDHPNGKWEAREAMQEHGLLRGIPPSVEIARAMAHPWPGYTPDRWASITAGLIHDQRAATEWQAAMEAKGATLVVARENQAIAYAADAVIGKISYKYRKISLWRFSPSSNWREDFIAGENTYKFYR